MKAVDKSLSYEEFKKRYLSTNGFLFEDSLSVPGYTKATEYSIELENFEVRYEGNSPQTTQATIHNLFRKLEFATKQGYFVQINLYYELGYFLIDKLHSIANSLEIGTILAKGKIFSEKKEYTYVNAKLSELGQIQFDLFEGLTAESYFEKFNLAQDHLHKGDCYELNLCFQNQTQFEGDIFDFYQSLKRKQKTKYSAFLPFAGGVVLSFSPELFFHRSGYTIRTEPMKGTISRGLTSELDSLNKEILFQSTKDRSENVMITDLFRNDLGKISEIGSVETTSLFQTIPLFSVWQMVSEIKSTIRKDIDIIQMFEALFPSGSITGAPKIRSMEILRDLEKKNRGLYTGSILRWEDNAGNLEMLASISIRTLEITKENETLWTGNYGIGSAVTVLSNALDEYSECISKTKFLTTTPPPDFQILETIRYGRGRFRFQNVHLERMAGSATRFGFPFSYQSANDCLDRIKQILAVEKNPKRIRFLLNGMGMFSYEVFDIPLKTKTVPIRLWIYPKEIPKNDLFLVHKTTHRTFYETAQQETKEQKFDDCLFIDSNGYLVETTIRNVFVRLDSGWVTPRLQETGLKGVFRNKLVKKGWVKEVDIHLSQIHPTTQIMVGNSLRGFERAILQF